MLKRHEVTILLKAGHPRGEVARLSGVSLRSVNRIAQESPVLQVDDAVERAKRRIGRPSTVTNFQKLIVAILQLLPLQVTFAAFTGDSRYHGCAMFGQPGVLLRSELPGCSAS